MSIDWTRSLAVIGDIRVTLARATALQKYFRSRPEERLEARQRRQTNLLHGFRGDPQGGAELRLFADRGGGNQLATVALHDRCVGRRSHHVAFVCKGNPRAKGGRLLASVLAYLSGTLRITGALPWTQSFLGAKRLDSSA